MSPLTSQLTQPKTRSILTLRGSRRLERVDFQPDILNIFSDYDLNCRLVLLLPRDSSLSMHYLLQIRLQKHHEVKYVAADPPATLSLLFVLNDSSYWHTSNVSRLWSGVGAVIFHWFCCMLADDFTDEMSIAGRIDKGSG